MAAMPRAWVPPGLQLEIERAGDESPEAAAQRDGAGVDSGLAAKAEQVHRLLKAGRLSEMSFAYHVREGSWGEVDGQEVYELKAVKLLEVSVVPIGANPDTSIVDVNRGVLLDVVPGRGGAEPAGWLAAQGDEWLAGIEWVTLDLSGPYRAVFNRMLPHAVQIADPFHVVRLANQKLDECRRRVQNETLGHRGHKGDPLYRCRRLLTKADERLDEKGRTKLLGLLAAGDPRGDVKTTWHAKEVIRSIYDIDDPELADEFVTRLASDLQDQTFPPEVRSLGRTLTRWKDQIVAWHRGRVTNGPTEAANNLIKRIKRIAFGFRRFRSYRIRVLLYAGRPNWNLLATVTPR